MSSLTLQFDENPVPKDLQKIQQLLSAMHIK
jgi:hypothetical protein